MTGSGKTGLGIGLIEEAAHRRRAGAGDRSEGRSREPAADVPRTHRRGLRAVGESRRRAHARDGRVRRWRRARRRAGSRGSRSGDRAAIASRGCARPRSSRSTRRAARPARPLSIVEVVCAAAGGCARGRPELLGERVSTAATSLLTLAGVESEPLRSREHMLVSTLLQDAWRQRRRRSILPALIAAVQTPPMHDGRRARSRVVLSGRRSLRAGDAAQPPARRA